MPADHATSLPECELFAVELRTQRWADLVAWYRTVLGLRVLLRIVEDEYAMLAAGTTRIAIAGRADVGPVSNRQLLVFEVADLDATISRLQEAGAEPSERNQHSEGFWESTVNDPDGNRLRLFQWPSK